MGQSLSPGAPLAFQKAVALKAQFGTIASNGDLFVATTSKGAYQLIDDRAVPIQTAATVPNMQDAPARADFRFSRYDASRVYVGLANGLAFLELRAGKWQFTGQAPGIDVEINEIEEESPDVLWLTTRLGKVIRLELPSLYLSPPPDFSSAKIERYGEGQGLSKGRIRPRLFNGKFVFATGKGLRRFDPASRTFQLDSSFGEVFADSTWNIGVGPFEIDRLGRA